MFVYDWGIQYIPPVQYTYRIVRVGGHPAVVAQCQSTGGSSQRCPGFDPWQLPSFSLSSIFCLITPNFQCEARFSEYFEQVWHKIFQTLVGDSPKSVCSLYKKFNLVHRTVSPHERVASGDKTLYQVVAWELGALRSYVISWHYTYSYTFTL